MAPGSNRCFGQQSDQPPQKQPTYIALYANQTGKFFGVGIAKTREKALAEAKAVCEAYKADTYSSEDERMEYCNHKVVTADGCVALTKSSDYIYGEPTKFAAGMSTDYDLTTAINESMGSCKQKGGGSCFTVPEAARCSDPSKER